MTPVVVQVVEVGTPECHSEPLSMSAVLQWPGAGTPRGNLAELLGGNQSELPFPARSGLSHIQDEPITRQFRVKRK